MSIGRIYRETFLTELFRRASDAGWGVADRATFIAWPGHADGAVSYMDSITDEVIEHTDMHTPIAEYLAVLATARRASLDGDES